MRRAKHRGEPYKVYWRFTYRFYRHHWLRLTWKRVAAELSDAYATLKVLSK